MQPGVKHQDQRTCGKRIIWYTTTSLFTQGGSIKGGLIEGGKRRGVFVCVSAITKDC